MVAYEILNPPAFSKKSQHGKFIYVLMFNVAGRGGRPFYVGQTSGLTARFGDHSMMVWHFAKFGSPAQVWIAGHVRTEEADSAEQDLISRLSKSGYLLTNNSIASSSAKRFQKQHALFQRNVAEVCAYLDRTLPKTSVVVEWKKRWMPEPPNYVLTGSSLTSEQVVEYAAGLSYSSPALRNLSLAIAQGHDSGLGYSRVVLKAALRGVPGASKIYKRSRQLTWLWFFNRALLPDKPHDFRLTNRHIEALMMQNVDSAGPTVQD